MTVLRRALIASSIAWALLLPLAPFAASQPAPARFWYGLAFVVYGAGSFICHQLPDAIVSSCGRRSGRSARDARGSISGRPLRRSSRRSGSSGPA